MEKEIIYDKTSEEYKAIKLLESKTTNYSDDGIILHYNTILYNLIINLIKYNEKQKEIIDKLSNIIYEIKDSIETTGGYPSDYIDDLLKILEDKEV